MTNSPGKPRRRIAAVLAVMGVLAGVLAVVISLAAGYDRLGYGTPGSNVTTLLFVTAIVTITLSVIFAVRSNTPPGRLTPWRGIGLWTVGIWGACMAVFVIAVLIGRLIPVAAPMAVLVGGLLPVLLLPILIWLPIWTVLNAIRGRAASGHSEPSGDQSAVVQPVPPSVPGAGAEPHVGTSGPNDAAAPGGAPRWMFFVIGVGTVLIVALVAAVAFLLGQQSQGASAVAGPGTNSTDPAPTPTSVLPSPSDEAASMTATQAYGLAAAWGGCLGSGFEAGLTWEPIYHQVATDLGLDDISPFGEEGLKEVNRKGYAFWVAEAADPQRWQPLSSLWGDSVDFAYRKSESVARAGEPRGFAFEAVSRKYGPALSAACLDAAEAVGVAATEEGLTAEAWLEGVLAQDVSGELGFEPLPAVLVTYGADPTRG